MQSSKKINEKIKERTFTDYFRGAVLAFIIGIIPAIVRFKIVDVSSAELLFLRSNSTFNDIFSYYKSNLIMIAGVILLISAVMEIILEENPNKINYKSPFFILVTVFVLCIIISTFASEYSHIPFFGISERYEGMWVLLSYIVFMVCAKRFVTDNFTLRFILTGLGISAVVVGGIGFFQFFGKDFFATQIGQKLILGDYYDKIKNFNIMFDNVFSTLYNPNCAGMYSAMMFMIFIMLAVFLPVKNVFKYLSMFFSVITFITLVGSDSSGSFIGFAAAVFAGIVLFMISFIKNKRYKELKPVHFAGIAAFIVIFAGIFIFNPTIKERLHDVAYVVMNPMEQRSSYYYKDLKIEDEQITLTTVDGELKLKKDGDKFSVTGYDGKVLTPTSESKIEGKNGTSYSYDIVNSANPTLQCYDDKVVFSSNGITFMFKYIDGKFVPLKKKGELLDLSEEIPSIGFEGRELLGTGRGYIWSRSIPVAFDNMIIGSGPDTFALEFPQDDIIGKTRYFGNPYVMIDKPHSIYLQTAIQTGILSLLVFLAIIGLYCVSTLKAVVKKENIAYSLAFFCGVTAYLISGLSTDSVVSVAPIFWVMLGCGFAVNEASEL
ncbi:MAG: O-antigen ligase family protein [Firmicutes bacterium]|nr:O-antigen ligase family protein [Bacillota bacterium]